MKFIRIVKWAIVVSCSVCAAVAALPGTAMAERAKTFGLGVQSAPFPIHGLSVQYHPSNRLGFQVIAKTGYDVDILTSRVLYRFNSSERTRLYGSGMAGVFRDSHVTRTLFAREETDTAPGFGLGVGVEHFFTPKSRLGFNAEIDYVHIAFEKTWFEYDYDTWSLVMLGVGIHYYL